MISDEAMLPGGKRSGESRVGDTRGMGEGNCRGTTLGMHPLRALKAQSTKDLWLTATALSYGPGTDSISSNFELGRNVPEIPESAGRVPLLDIKALEASFSGGVIIF